MPVGLGVHPHVRGAHAEVWRSHVINIGPSPRAWGSQEKTPQDATKGRSIPTCVGLTRGRWFSGGASAVHPHVRGAHPTPGTTVTGTIGPSPRAWGSPGTSPRRYPWP